MFGRDLLLQLYKVVLVFFFYFFWYLVCQFVGGSVFNWVVFEVVDVVEMCFFQEVEQYLEIFFCFVWEVYNKSGVQGQIWVNFMLLFNVCQLMVCRIWMFYQFQNMWVGVLQWNIEVWQNFVFCYQWDYIVNVWVWIDIVQVYLDVEFCQFFVQIDYVGFYWYIVVEVGVVFDVDVVGGGVL